MGTQLGIDRLNIVSDFETGKLSDNSRAWVYLGVYKPLGEEAVVTRSIEQWFNSLVATVKRRRKGADVWFHNLLFDGSFILNYALSNGIDVSKTVYGPKLLQIELKIRNGSRQHTIVFRDTYLLLHRSIRTIGKAIGFEKHHLEYNSYPECCDTIPQSEIDYAVRDVEILERMVVLLIINLVDAMTAAAYGIKELKRLLCVGEAREMSVEAGEAANIYKLLMNTQRDTSSLVEYLRTVKLQNRVLLGRYVERGGVRYVDNRDSGLGVFDSTFPRLILWDDYFIRDAYKGGFCKLAEQHRGILFDKPSGCGPKTRAYFNSIGFLDSEIDQACVVLLDVNLLYLKVLRDYNLPCGIPKYFSDSIPDNMNCGFVHLRWCGYKVDDRYGPIHDDLPNDSNIDYLDNINNWVELTLTYPELYVLLMDQVDGLVPPPGMEWLTFFSGTYVTVNYQIIDGYTFDYCSGMFDLFVDKWYSIKHGDDPMLKILAKLVLTNSIGAIGRNPKMQCRLPKLVDGVLQVDPSSTVGDTSYVPLPAYVNSIGRCLITLAANLLGDRFIYLDTDSVHFLLDGEVPFFDSNLPLFMLEHELGGFKVERLCSKARFIKLKTYIEITVRGNKKVTAAGIPDADDKFSWDGEDGLPLFNIGAPYTVLTPKQVVGGVALIELNRYIKKAETFAADVLLQGE